MVAGSSQHARRVSELPGAGSHWAQGQQHLPLAWLAAEGTTPAVLMSTDPPYHCTLGQTPGFHFHNIEDNYVAVNKWW